MRAFIERGVLAGRRIGFGELADVLNAEVKCGLGDVVMNLSSDFKNPMVVPYFLWDEPMTVTEFRRRLKTALPPERARLLGKLLREARDTEVWEFASLAEIVREWPSLEPHLGRRRPFWNFLMGQWRQEGLLGT